MIIGLVALQRLAELAISQRNTRKLLAEGGYEVGRGHYIWFVLLHATWLLSMLGFIDPDATLSFAWLSFFLLLQAARVWVMRSLGRYWTTRVITVPDAPLVRRGPYRLMRHPNYAIVVGEIAALPLGFGAWKIALVFSLLNAGLLFHRIRTENLALDLRRHSEDSAGTVAGTRNDIAIPSD